MVDADASVKAAWVLVVCLALWSSVVSRADTPALHSDAPYDANPQHLWNRFNDTLFVRTAPDNGEGSTLERETTATLAWKSRQFDWGLLRGLW